MNVSEIPELQKWVHHDLSSIFTPLRLGVYYEVTFPALEKFL